MTRLEYCKRELEKLKSSNEELKLKFQELNNLLPTYKEKKELSNFLQTVEKS